MSIYATIDVGSNSVLLHIARRLENGQFRPILDRATVTRLGEGLHATGRISEQAAERTLEELRTCAEAMRSYRVTAFAAVGTMCLRTATNAGAFIERVHASTGIPIEVISGEEEARLSYLAVASGTPGVAGDIAVFDVGGGSTEFTFGRGDRIVRRFSLEVGAIRLLETYLREDPPTLEAFEAMTRYLHAAFAPLEAVPGHQVLVGVGGTLATMAAVKLALAVYDGRRTHGTVLEAAEVARQVTVYRTTPLEARKRLRGMQPGRADVIVAGAAIVETVMKRLNAGRVVVSDRGLRHGLMMERFGPGREGSR